MMKNNYNFLTQQAFIMYLTLGAAMYTICLNKIAPPVTVLTEVRVLQIKCDPKPVLQNEESYVMYTHLIQ
jgi:hypothetical protein